MDTNKPEHKGWEVKQMRCGAVTGEIQATEPVEVYVATFYPAQSLTASVELKPADADPEREVHYLKRKLAYRDTEIEELKRQIAVYRERANQTTPDKQTTDAEIQRAIELLAERRSLVYDALDKQIPDADRDYLWRNIKSFDLAILALQQMAKPADAEVQAAIEWLESDFDYQSGCDCPICLPGHKHVQTILAALRHQGQIPEISNCRFLAERGDYWAWEDPAEANNIDSMVDSSYVMIKAGTLRPMYRALQQMQKPSDAEVQAEENRLSEIGKYRFYYCESSGEYLLGMRLDNFYYARWLVNAWTWCMSKYLPWGETVNGFTFDSEPVEIGADEFFNGWSNSMRAQLATVSEDVQAAIDDLQSSYDCDARLDRDYLETPVLLKSAAVVLAAIQQDTRGNGINVPSAMDGGIKP